MNADPYDVIIVGAGPGGSAAAAELARRGCRVLLLDKADFPRDKTCGDGLTPRAVVALGRLGLGELLAGVPRLGRALVVAPDGAAGTTDLQAGPGVPDYVQIVPRLVLDNALRQHALAAGAEFVSPVHVTRLARRDDGVEVSGEQRGQPVAFQARAAIVATGASPALLAQMGLLRHPPRVGLAVRGYFEGLTGLAADQIQFRFDGVPMPGYAWIFPTSASTANIGLGLFVGQGGRALESARAPQSARAAFEHWRQWPAVRQTLGDARLAGPLKGFPIRADFLDSPTVAERVLVVGEAAGLVNPLTGDGIDFALESGLLAAEHLAAQLAAGDLSARALAGYARALRRRYTTLFYFSLGVRRFALGHPRLLNRLVREMPGHPRLVRGLIWVLLGRTDEG